MPELIFLDDIRSWLEEHQTVWDLDEFLELARFHACIHDADVELLSRVYKEVPAGLADFTSLETTPVGREVGGDVPRWWVLSREQRVQELREETKHAFVAAQTILRSAEKICCEPATTYREVIKDLKGFLRENREEIHRLFEYSAGLSRRNELAPAILFSYAVWGSTRRSERALPEQSDRAPVDKLRLAGELALGLQTKMGPTVIREWLDLLDQSELMTPSGQPAAMPATKVLYRFQVQVRERLVTYFRGVRDSLRHTDTVCQEWVQREFLYADDRFAKSLLRKVTSQERTVENELWDIKENLEMWCAPTRQERKAAAIRFVECVAAFANRRGGVVLIGVSDSTRSIVGVDDEVASRSV